MTVEKFDCAALFEKADAAGKAAADAMTPVPMVVGTPTTMFGNDIDQTKPTYFVADGVCGFAWVNVKPANCAFAKYLTQIGKARPAYRGGVDMNVRDYNQGMQRKAAYAKAFANVLQAAGVRAYAYERMD